MTGDGTRGVFMPEGVVVGKVAQPMGGRVTGRRGWSHNRLWKGEAYTECPKKIEHFFYFF